MLLSSCLSFSQATVNPGATATSGIPNTGGFEQSGTSTVNNQGQTGGAGTAVGTMVPFVPETGEFSMEGTPQPPGTTVASEDGLVFPYAASPFPGLGTSAAGTPAAVNDDIHGDSLGTGVPNTGAGASEALVRLTQIMNYSFGDNSAGNLGQVTDFVINIPQARISYVVLNANNRSVLVPWSSINFNGQSFGFSGSSDQLNNAPVFDQSGVDFSNQNWDQNYQSFWGSNSGSGTGNSNSSTTGGSGSQGTGSFSGMGTSAILASQLLRVQVVAPGFNGSGQAQSGTAVPNTGSNLGIGQVQDALVSQSSGAVPWLLVSVSSNFINLNNRVIPVPFPAISNLDVNGLFLTLNQSLLGSAPNLDASNLPNLFGSGWDQQFFQYWNNSGFNNPQATAQP